MCVILFTKINDSNSVLFKNRDRFYKSNVKIIHEIRDGTEVAYIYDHRTGWIEGMNEYGIGIINSTFTILKDNSKKANHQKVRDHDSKKGQKILLALTKSNILDAVKLLVSNDNLMEGHTLICDRDTCYHIEHKKKQPEYVFNEIKSSISFTNHGIYFPEEGNIRGKKAFSSVLRKAICDYELNSNEITSKNDLFEITNKYYYNIEPSFHVYRDGKESFFKEMLKMFQFNKPRTATTSQMLLNLNEKELIYYYDINNSSFLGIENKLSKDYNPVIKIKTNVTSKRIQMNRLNLNPEIIERIREKFSYRENDFNNSTYVVLFIIIIFIVFYFICKNIRITKLFKTK